MTLNVYGHWLEASDQDAAEVIGGLLAERGPETTKPPQPEG